ncbi:MAG: NAD(P)H-dependent oxidoreductase subunit E [Saprospiraceae bacterium]
MALVNEIIIRYPEGKHKSALIPLLHLAQNEFGGWLSPESMDYVASILKIAPVEVYEVATFYSMFNLQPVGKYMLEVCQTGPCGLNGADKIINYLKHKLNIDIGETSADGLFTLKTVECLASCGTAPMMQVGEHYYENLTPSSIDHLLKQWSNK